MKHDRTELVARENARRWAVYASAAERAGIMRIAEHELVTFDRLRAVVDPRGELSAAELHEIVGWTCACDPDRYAEAFILMAAAAFEER